MSESNETVLWIPGRRTKRLAKITLASLLILLTLLGSVGAWLPGIVQALGLSPSLSEKTASNCITPLTNATLSPTTTQTPKCATSTQSASQEPQKVGADKVPSLSLPEEIVSGVGSAAHTVVTQDDSQSATVSSSTLSVRLHGGATNYDELLQTGVSRHNPRLSWRVEANEGNQWVPLRPGPSNPVVMGTNASGSYASRTTAFGMGSDSGVLSVFYAARLDGKLKWALDFHTLTSGHYRLVLEISNATQVANVIDSSAQVQILFSRYTLSWADVPRTYNSTLGVNAAGLILTVDLGNMQAGSKIYIDPSLVGTSSTAAATDFPYQHRVYQDPKTGYYWVFYVDGSSTGLVYKYSVDGINWSPNPAHTMPSGWPTQPTWDTSDYATMAPALYFTGETVIAAIGTHQSIVGQSSLVVSPVLVVGTIAGTQINWGTVSTQAYPFTELCYSSPASQCYIDAGVRYVSVALDATGRIWLSFDEFWYSSPNPANTCYDYYSGGNLGFYAESYLYVVMYQKSGAPDPNNPQFVEGHNNGSKGICYRYDSGEKDRSAMLPADYQGVGGTTILFQFWNHTYTACCGSPYGQVATTYRQLIAQWSNGVQWQPSDIIEPSMGDNDAFSAASDLEDGTHFGIDIVYTGTNGNITYAHRSAFGPLTYEKDILGGSASFPTITTDYSTNDVYAFGIVGSGVRMRMKTFAGHFSDRSITYPVTGRKSALANLESGFAAASTTNSSYLTLIWSEGAASPYNVTFASIPIQTVWSPYGAMHEPWDANGVAPYGQYFQNQGEYVSPSTGMLTVEQKDLAVPGRGLNLEITRLYTEPFSFLNGQIYNYETYPWAPMGYGWQLNFPWMNNSAQPLYLHLSEGRGYRIPSTFWTGATATFENHQGDNFRLARYSNGTISLFDKSGTSYNFNATNHGLTSITDSTGNNTLTFRYTNNVISCITDTVGRAFTFSYASGLLQSTSQVGGTCTSPGSTIRTISFTNNGQSLLSERDPIGRTTSYAYSATAASSVNPWLLSRITYPTAWFTNYTYTTALLGTQAVIYRVKLQITGPSLTSPTRQFAYAYNQPVGAQDQVINSTVTSYNGTQVVSYTKYAYSFQGVTKNVTDANHNFISGNQQLFGVNGGITKQIFLVSDGQGHIGAYTNSYSYDLWGNQIYSRQVINNSTGTYHETFNAYYNDGLPPGFYAFQDTFSQSQGTASDNHWKTLTGIWAVANGAYNGTESPGNQEDVLASADVGKSDVSIQSRIYVGHAVNSTPGYGDRFGIFTHYTVGSNRSNKWALVLVTSGSSPVLELLDEWNVWLGASQPSAINSCTGISPLIAYGTWYTFNMTVHGYYATGSVSVPGKPACTVSGNFPTSSPAASGTSFGLYAGGYSVLFDDVQVSTDSPSVTGTGFSNSFIQNHAPGPVGVNTWLSTTKPPGSGWNTTQNWLPATSWSMAPRAQDFTGATWTWALGNFPDKTAQWIWATPNSNVSASADPVWFRRIFYLPATTTIAFTATADNTFVLYVDGQRCAVGTDWTVPQSCTVTKGSGYHILALNATNPDGTTYSQPRPDPAGLLLTAINTANNQVVFHTDAVAGFVIGALAGNGQLQNGASSLPQETYYGYTLWGGVNQTRTRNDSFGSIPRLDGSTSNFCDHSTNSCTATLTTNAPNDIIIVYTTEALDLQYQCSFSVTDTAGLSWASRGGSVFSADHRWQLQEFWSKTAGVLTGDNITESISGCASTQYGGEYNGLEVFGISGENFNSPFDPNVGLPGTGSDAASGQVSVTIAPVSTNTANDFVFAFVQHGTGAVAFPESGFTAVISVGGAGAEYQVTGATLANAAVSFSFNTVSLWQEIADAVQPAGTTSAQWLTTTRTYDTYGNLLTSSDPRGNVTSYSYSATFKYAYLTTQSQTVSPGSTPVTSSFGYNFTTGSKIWAQQPKGYGSSNYNTTYTYDTLGRLTRMTYPTPSSSSGNLLTNPGFETGDFTGWAQTSMIIRSNDKNSGLFSAAPYYNASTFTYSAFTLQQNLQFPVSGNLVTAIQLWYRYGSSSVDSAQVLYSDGTYTQTTLSVVTSWTLKTLSFTSTKQIIGIKIVRSAGSGTNIYLDDFLITAKVDFVIYSYNDNFNYVDITNENGGHSRQIYDGLGRLVTSERFLGSAPYSNQTSTYNGMNGVSMSTDALGNTFSHKYDALGRETAYIQPDGNSTQETYNDMASWVRITDQYLNFRCNIYDRLGRLISVIDGADSNCQTGIVSNYYYDEVGDLVKLTNANQQSTGYMFDNQNRLSQTIYADRSSESYNYDNNGNIVKKVDRNGFKTLASYDSLNRPMNVTYCGPPMTSQSYTYDLNGNTLSIQNQNATLTYSYDSRNRVINESYAVNLATRRVVDLGCSGGGGTSTVSGGVARTYAVVFTYTGETMASIAYPTTTGTSQDITAGYTYDLLGRVLNVTKLGTSTYYARSFTYYKNDQVKGLQFGNNLVGNYTYDRLSRPLKITLTGTTTMSLTYSYNKTGTVSSVTGLVNGATVNEQYKYDRYQRLINSTVTSSGSTIKLWYQYDNMGNMLAQSFNGTVTTYSYNSANNELTRSSTSGTTVTYAYDKNGNLLNKNVTTTGTVNWYYKWDASNHLLRVTNGTGQALYAYDGAGRRVEAIEGGSTWYFAYVGAEILYKNVLNTSNNAYVYAAAMRICVVVNINWDIYYYHTDALGSTRIITYTDATYVYVNNYRPFGTDNGTPQGVYQNRATDKFAGEPYSPATGLYYDFQRWYDPSIGRFISQDSSPGRLSDPRSLNYYAYVENSPVTNIDPTGQFLIEALVGAAAGALVGYVGCGIVTGGWASSQCGEAALGGAAFGALAGLTDGVSLLLEGGGDAAVSGICAEECGQAASAASQDLVETADFFENLGSTGSSSQGAATSDPVSITSCSCSPLPQDDSPVKIKEDPNTGTTGEKTTDWQYKNTVVRMKTGHAWVDKHLFVNTDLTEDVVESAITKDVVGRAAAGDVTPTANRFFLDLGGITIQYNAVQAIAGSPYNIEISDYLIPKWYIPGA